MDLEFGKKNIKIYLLYFLSAIIVFPIKIFYSRTLSVEDFGAFFALFSLIVILSPISNLGFSESLNFFIPKYKNKKEYSKIINSALIVQIIGSFFLFLLFIIFSKDIALFYLKSQKYLDIVKYFSILLLLVPLSYTIMNIYRSNDKEEYYIYIDTTKNILILTLSLTLFFLNFYNIKTLIIAWIFSYFITNTYYLYNSIKMLKYKIEEKVNIKILKEMLSYSYINLLGSSIAIFFSYTDTIMITLFSTTLQTGYYNAVLPIASILLLTIMPLNILLYPYFSKIYHQKKNVNKELKNALFFSITLNTIIFSILFLNSELLIKILIGEKYLYSNNILLVLLVAFFINSINLIFTFYYSATNEIKFRLKTLITALILNIILNYYLIQKYSSIGAAIATLISFTFLFFSYSIKSITKEKKEKIKTTLFYTKTILTIAILITLLLELKKIYVFSIKNILLINITNIIIVITLLLILYFKEIKLLIDFSKELYKNIFKEKK